MVFLSQEQSGETGLDNIEAAIQDMGCDKQIPVMILVLGRSLLFMCAKGLFQFSVFVFIQTKNMFAATPQS